MTDLTLLPGMDSFNRVLGCRDTFVAKMVREALLLGRFEPAILLSLAADIDRAAKEAKKLRLMDELWREESLPPFPGFVDWFGPSDFDGIDADAFTLGTGRARSVWAELLLVLVVVDGVFSLTSVDGYERLVGSEVFQAFMGDRLSPARSTVGKYLDLVSPGSHQLLHEALCRKVRAEGLDTFEELTVDSTAIEANSSWPTESALILGFLGRIHRLLDRQATHTGVAYSSKLVDRWLAELAALHRQINLMPSRPGSAAERRKLYHQLLRLGEKTRRKLRELLDNRRERIADSCILPTLRLRVDGMLSQIDADFDEAGKASASARARVLRQESVPACEKAFSLADPDAYMIVKGQRDPVVGYKPQIGRSAAGFITCFEVTRGNPADTDRLLPMLQAHVEATGVCPAAVSTDDGYSSAANLAGLADAGVETVSFSGATGRQVLGDEFYATDTNAILRSERSAVESLMFTFKHKLGMRRFCRRGLAGVRKDLSAAVLAHNLWRIAFVRSSARSKEPEPAAGEAA